MLLSPNVLKACGAASKEEHRYQLCGVHFKYARPHVKTPLAQRVEACATDGKQLLVVRETVPDPTEFPSAGDVSAVPDPNAHFILPTSTCKTLEKAIPRHISKQKPILGYALVDDASVNGTAKVATFSDELRPAVSEHDTVEGTFPDYSCVYQKDEPRSEALLNLAVLENAVRTLRAVVGRDKDAVVRLSVWKSSVPIALHHESPERQSTMFVMPMATK